MTMSWGEEVRIGDGEWIDETHDFKVTTLVGGVLWAVKGTAKMKWGVVDEFDVDVGRLVILAVLGE
jgi:hypothetical protein